MSHNGKALLAAAAAGLVVIGGVHWWNGRDDTADAPRAGCTTVVVTASVEKAALMAEVANRYNASDRQVNGNCYGISVNATPSGVAESQLAEAGWDPAWGPAPDAWSPAASTWLQLLRHDRTSHDRPDILAADNESVVSTPIVLAMPEPKAKALGWPGAAIGWADLLELANNPGGWASKGHPEWGAFKLGKTNPNVSTSGLSATIGAFVAATGTSSDLTLDTLKEPRVREFVAGVEKSVAHYGDTALTFLTNLQRADDAGAALGYVSAVAVEEKSVVDYNTGNPTGDLHTAGQHGSPRVPLVAIYPKEGTLNSDSPFAVLRAPWSEAGKQAGAKDFLAYLREPAGQELFTDAGFRTYDGRPGKVVADSEYLADDVGVVLSPPSPSGAVRGSRGMDGTPQAGARPARAGRVRFDGRVGRRRQDQAGTRTGRGGEWVGPVVRHRPGRIVDVPRTRVGLFAAPAARAARPATPTDDQPHPTAHPVGRHSAVCRYAAGGGGCPRRRRRGHDQRDRRDD